MKRKKIIISLISIAILAITVAFFALSNGHQVDDKNSSIVSTDNGQPQTLPTPEPTVVPSPEPTVTPATEPTSAPTGTPTDKPTSKPTEVPAEKPSLKPTEVPTQKPTPKPTETPTQKPTPKPTTEPTEKPTTAPTTEPSVEPKPEPDLSKYVLTAADVKRIMALDIIEGPFFLSNEEYKQKVPKYSFSVNAAKEFMELHENYNYKDLSTESGKAKFVAGLNKYNSDPEDLQNDINNDKISYVISHKLIQKAVFLTSDDCIFKNGNRQTTVRGILYFVVIEGTQEDYEKGIVYKMDVEVYLSGSPDSDQFNVMGYYPLSKSVKCK